MSWAGADSDEKFGIFHPVGGFVFQPDPHIGSNWILGERIRGVMGV